MSGNGSVEDNGVGNSSEKTEEEVHETRTLTQESVNEQIKGFIAPHTSARGIDSADSGDDSNAACEQLPGLIIVPFLVQQQVSSTSDKIKKI